MSISIKKIHEFTGHSSPVYCLCPGNNEHSVFSGSGDKFVAEWNLTTNSPERFSLKLPATPYAMAHIQAKQLLVVGTSSGSMHWIDLSKRQELHQFNYHQQAIYRLLNISDRLLVASSADGSFSVWDIQLQKHLRTLYLSPEKIRSLAISPDGLLLAVGCGDGTIRVFDTIHFNEYHTLKGHNDSVTSLVFDPNGKQLISGGKDAHINVWDTNASFELLKRIPAHNYAIYELIYSTSGNYVISASRDKTIKIWDRESMVLYKRIDFKSFKAHTHSVNALVWNPSLNYLVSAGDDRKIISWKIF